MSMSPSEDDPAALPPALDSLLMAVPERLRAWESLQERDRAKYAEWVSAARSAKAAERRARVVIDRVSAGHGWAGPLPRFFRQHFTLPPGTTVDEVRRADYRGETAVGGDGG